MKRKLARLTASLLCLSLLSSVSLAAGLSASTESSILEPNVLSMQSPTADGTLSERESEEASFANSAVLPATGEREKAPPTEAPETPTSTEVPGKSTSTEAPETPTSTEAPGKSTSTEAPETPTSTEAPEKSTSTEAPETPTSTEAPEKSTSTEAPETPTSTEDSEEAAELPIFQLTDDQIIQKFNLSTRWSRKALIFAVRNGILYGVSKNNLAPQDNTTQAQLSTMLIRILKTEKTADLSGFQGVKSSSWYYYDLQRTVSLGLFPIADRNSKTLTPNRFLSREEVFVVLARLFGLKSNNRQAIYRFPDWEDVSDWAAEPIAALIEHGYVSGSSGKLLPKANISRQELAQILFNLLTKIGTSLDSTEFTGRVALAADTLPSNTIISGDLLLSTDSTEISLDRLTVTGRMILQGNGMLRLNLEGCNIRELVICRPTEVTTDNPLHNVVNHALFRLYGQATRVDCFDLCVVLSGSAVETLNVMNGGRASVAQGGTIQLLNVLGDHVYTNGLGQIKKCVVRGAQYWNECANTNTTVHQPFPSVKNAVATRTDSGTASDGQPELTLGLKLTNMPEGWSECNLKWYVNGEVISTANRRLLQEGSVITAVHNFSHYLNEYRSEVELSVSISCGGVQSQLYKGSVKLENSVEGAARKIRTQNVQGKLLYAGTLYAYQSNLTLNTPIASYPAGTQVTVLQSRCSLITKVRMPDGNVGWMSFNNVSIIQANYYTTTDYPTAVKEYYVNHIRNCSSPTGYLIWISLYTQRANIFTGSKGNWKLVRTCPIASGMNYCPTPVEDVQILYKTSQWNYANYYCHHVSVFDEARGFHSRPTAYGGWIYAATIGSPASAGCVRMLDEDCTYIYNNCPVNTSVHIY